MSSVEDQEKAAAAVLVESEPMPEDAIKIAGIDFNSMQTKSRERGYGITVDEIMSSMCTTGFQASSLGKAIDVIEQMVWK